MSTGTTPPNLQLQVITASELSSDADLREALTRLVNDAYQKDERSVVADLFTTTRLHDSSQIPRELADTGILGYITDKDDGSGPYAGLAAVGGLKKWKGNSIEQFLRDQGLDARREAKAGTLAETENWEVTLCASASDVRYRRMGLVTRCVERCTQVVSAKATKPVKLWMSVLDGMGNVEYWTRRGFVPEGAVQVAPKGVWHSTREFGLVTMSKLVVS